VSKRGGQRNSPFTIKKPINIGQNFTRLSSRINPLPYLEKPLRGMRQRFRMAGFK
jgi:hypothetical protein